MRNDEYKPRFSFEISEEQKIRSDRLLSAFGVKRALFGVILDDTLDMIEKHGEKFIIAVTSRIVKVDDILKSAKHGKEISEKLEEANG